MFCSALRCKTCSAKRLLKSPDDAARFLLSSQYLCSHARKTPGTAIGLTQTALAQVLGLSRHAVQGWEGGSNSPKAESLKRFIALGVKLQAFAAGREEEEIRTLWQAAHQKVLLDELWLSSLLSQ